MAFDSGMLASVAYEINKLASGARVDKINQPEKAEAVFTLRATGETLRLCISASSGSPRICFEKNPKENPITAPSLCMALRKYLGGSKLISAELLGFERIILFKFAARDELGYIGEKRIYAEIMGKSSGFFLCDGDDRIITGSRFVDLSANAERKILPGMKYTLPPPQDKLDTMKVTKDIFFSRLDRAPEGMSAEAFIRNSFLGISPLVSREIVFLASGSVDSVIGSVSKEKLWFFFESTVNIIKTCDFSPCVIKGIDGSYIDFCFMPIKQYKSDAICEIKESVSDAVEEFFAKKGKAETEKHYAHDIFTAVNNAHARLAKKITLFQKELEDCKQKDDFKRDGDLITANIYRIKKGDTLLEATDWSRTDENGNAPLVRISLSSRLSPSQNAQAYYKKYTKLKNGELFKTEQLKKAVCELDYIDSVADSLERAGSDDEYIHIREELASGGYIKKSTVTPGRKPKSNAPVCMYLPTGREIYCGKNNSQNDVIDSKIASKNDWWFHIKHYPGSHVVMITGQSEPTEEEFTMAARLAAYNSKARGAENAEVDYTQVKNLKKPAGSAPGFVTYNTNYTAYVDAICPPPVSEKKPERQ